MPYTCGECAFCVVGLPTMLCKLSVRNFYIFEKRTIFPFLHFVISDSLRRYYFGWRYILRIGTNVRHVQQPQQSLEPTNRPKLSSFILAPKKSPKTTNLVINNREQHRVMQNLLLASWIAIFAPFWPVHDLSRGLIRGKG